VFLDDMTLDALIKALGVRIIGVRDAQHLMQLIAEIQ